MTTEAAARPQLHHDISWAALLALALLAYYLFDSPVLAAAATTVFAYGAWRRLDLALLTVIATAPFYRFPKDIGPLLGRDTPFEVSLAEYALLVCAAVWAAQRVRTGGSLRRFLRPSKGSKGWDLRTWGPPLLFLVPAVLAVAFAEHRHVALREFRVVMLEPAFYYVLLVSTLHTPQQAARALWALVLTGSVIAAYALYHYAFVGIVTEAGGVGRALAVYHSPNALALFLGRAVPVAAAFALVGILARSARLSHVAGAAATLLMLAATAITFSRGAVLGLGAALGFLLLAMDRRAALLVFAGLALAVVAALPFLPLDRLGEASPIAQRLFVWDAAWRMGLDHPLTGVGPDNFLYHYPDYMLPEAALQPDMSHAHNIFLDFWTRLGILGLAAMAWLQYHFWRTGAKLLRGPLAARERTLALAVMASMLDFLVHGLLDSSYFLIDLAFLFWLSFALLLVLDRHRDAAATPQRSSL